MTRRTDMTRLATVRGHLEQAESLAAVLDAAHDAFEDMLAVIRALEDPDEGLCVPMAMAAASAADGRNALAFAPSLPPHRLHPPAAGEQPAGPGPAREITRQLAALGGLLATRLTEAADTAQDPADRAACTDAARSARDIHALLAGSGP